ncbi:hypothetical protein BOW53_06170 [Solemya pervernicosa gill symbiont]|uniref:DUF4424 domain-containing protein n=1 Tax=Solemya pervernicosa gill symbiont TaxID=642797 RepID=A0A1T2L6W7_9GAMM|nr:hypothetical protein [Solemya pervernicosa gill symbiont]OOZ40800.1 hypothetical protein BOW53_06170 [Solemya pervernicosa gill symbiont]
MYRNGFKFVFLLLFSMSHSFADSDYWKLEIPIMDGGVEVERYSSKQKATIKLRYKLLLDKHTSPVVFYNNFFDSNGWEHHMKDTFNKYPSQFTEPPFEKWSSSSATSKDGEYGIAFSSIWQNKTIGSNATVSMWASNLEGELLDADIEVQVSPDIDASPFLKLVQMVQANPKGLLKLAKVAGGNPFKIDEINIEKVKALETDDDFILNYIEAVDGLVSQIQTFSEKHIK